MRKETIKKETEKQLKKITDNLLERFNDGLNDSVDNYLMTEGGDECCEHIIQLAIENNIFWKFPFLDGESCNPLDIQIFFHDNDWKRIEEGRRDNMLEDALIFGFKSQEIKDKFIKEFKIMLEKLEATEIES